MVTNNNSPFSGLVPVILVLVLIGALGALALSGSDLTNFITNSAKAQAIAQQNQIDAQKAAIDLKNYQTLQDSQTKVQQDKILADEAAYQKSLDQQIQNQKSQNDLNLQLQAQKAAQDIQTSRLIKLVLAGGGALAILIIGLGLAIFLIQVGRARLLDVQRKAKAIDPWQDQPWRKQQIALSRRKEQEMRIASKGQKTRVSPSMNRNSIYMKEEDKSNQDLPLAE